MSTTIVSIRAVEFIDNKEWLETCRSCDYATIFHTPFWSELFSAYMKKGRPRACKVTFNDSLSAIIPFYSLPMFGGLQTVWFSSYMGTYGGWISLDPLNGEHVRLLLSHLLQKRNLILRENPFAPWGMASDYRLQEDFTQALDLRRSESELSGAATPAHQRAIKKAIREGVSVCKASTETDWRAYYAVYQDSLRRWHEAGTGADSTVYGWKLFEILKQMSDVATLWLALKEERIIAGMLCFYWNNHAVMWHGAALESHLHLRPNNLLFQKVIDHARGNGYWWFDFNPSGEHQGVVQFKSQLGAVKMRSRSIVKTTPTIALYQLARNCYCRVIRKTPNVEAR